MKIKLNLVIFLLAGVAIAAPSKAKKVNNETYENALVDYGAYSETLMAPVADSKPSTAEITAAIKDQEAKRKVAQENPNVSLDAAYFEGKMSKQYKAFRERFLKITTAEQLDEALTELDLNWNSIPEEATDLKFVAAQIIPLRVFRGIVWRLIDVADTAQITHSMLLTQVKNIVVNTRIFFPTDQWKAGMDYLTQPFVQNGAWPYQSAFGRDGKAIDQKGVMIKKFPAQHGQVEAPLQAYFSGVVLPALRMAANRIELLNMSKNEYVWDNKFWYGTGSFKDAQDRYSLMGEVERQTALTNIYAALAEGVYQSAYSWNGAIAMSSDLGKLYGYDAVLAFSDVDGVPASKRHREIQGHQEWGVLFNGKINGKANVRQSLVYLKKAVEHGDLAWQAMKVRTVSSIYLIDNSAALTFQRPIEMRFDNLKAMVNGPKEIRSYVTGETVVVNLPAWYNNPPEDLKLLYGTQFDGSAEKINGAKVTTKMGEFVLPEYRNYLRGRATQWNTVEYQKLLPGVTNSDQLLRATRILTQSWGGGVIAMPIAGYIN